MPAYIVSNVPRPAPLTVNAPNEIWALELAAKKLGYSGGLDEYLARRADGEPLPNMEARLVPALTERAG